MKDIGMNKMIEKNFVKKEYFMRELKTRNQIVERNIQFTEAYTEYQKVLNNFYENGLSNGALSKKNFADAIEFLLNNNHPSRGHFISTYIKHWKNNSAVQNTPSEENSTRQDKTKAGKNFSLDSIVESFTSFLSRFDG